MTNNDILRRLRYAFDLSDQMAIKLFSLDPNSVVEIDKPGFSNRICKEDGTDYQACSDLELAAFLDGLIVSKRGLRAPPAGQSPTPRPTDFRLSKNDILKKLRIALNFKEQDMLDTLKIGGSELSKSELGALFRKPGHKHYRSCGGQVLRNFIKGLTITLRPS
ncbi:MAG: DUF1456 family protein [Acidiferrobacterales bacterium]|nr:DUF1456 family protein [Acidiferrobacterales bacterium]